MLTFGEDDRTYEECVVFLGNYQDAEELLAELGPKVSVAQSQPR